MRMTFVSGLRSFAIAAGIVAGTGFVPAAAQAPTLAMLDGLDSGEWELKFRNGDESRRICLRSGRELIQIRHSEPGCSRFVVEDGASEVTVQYTCRGNGYGRTNLRRETSRLVQLESQGIADGLPFQFEAEARRVGNCR